MRSEADSTSSGDNSSLADEAYQQILLRIIRGELPAGSELKSTRLAKELGVSRTPVVQALGRLVADGIVTQERNLRAVVSPGAQNWLVDVHELRILLEPPAAARAAERIDRIALTELRSLADAAAPDGDGEWIDAAREFDYAIHLAVADWSGNRALQQMIHRCWSYKQISYSAGTDTPEVLTAHYRDHLSILQALEQHQPDVAHAAMLFHLHNASRTRPGARIV